MEDALHVLNRLESEEVLGRYAIGGAMAALFYTEPVTTFDLDVFVVLPEEEASGLVNMGPLYEALRARGYSPEDEFVMIEGIPVQFLPVYNPLVEEALRDAREQPYGSITTRVFRAEHLVAIALQTGRSKDRERVTRLLEQADIDRDELAEIVDRYDLRDRWQAWTT